VPDPIEQYLAAWSSGDPEAVGAALAPDGTYQDPLTGGPLGGEALAGYVGVTMTAFPDLHFDLVSRHDDGETVALRWIMRGTNSGPLLDNRPTQATIAVPGADFFTLDATGAIAEVDGYFDQQTFMTQLGFQLIPAPQDLAPSIFYGLGVRADSGSRQEPGAFTVTWIESRDPAESARINDYGEQIVLALVGTEGVLSFASVVAGGRHYTFTAWDAPESIANLRHTVHAEAMKEWFADDGCGLRLFTSVWEPGRSNGQLVRCASCGKALRTHTAVATCARCGSDTPAATPFV